MTTMISGARGPEDWATSLAKRDVGDKILLLKKDQTALTYLTRKIAKKVTTNYKFEWYTDVRNPEWDAINNGAGEAADQTTLTVDNGSYFNAGDLVKVPRTGEVFYVSSISTNDLTVVRAYGETSAAAMNDNEPLLILGPALEDGANAPTAITTQKSLIYNYTQIFSRTIDFTERAANIDVYGQSDPIYQRKKKAEEFGVEMEKSFLFGERLQDTGTKDTNLTHYRTTTRGIIKAISTNTWDVAGTLAESDFDDWLGDTVFQYGSSTKWMFACSKIIRVIEGWGKEILRVNPNDSVYGLDIREYRSGFGTLKVIHHKLLTGDTYGKAAVIVDLDDDDLAYRYLKNCDIRWKTNIQGDNAHKKTDELYCDAGFQWGNEEKHAYMYGVTGAA